MASKRTTVQSTPKTVTAEQLAALRRFSTGWPKWKSVLKRHWQKSSSAREMSVLGVSEHDWTLLLQVRNKIGTAGLEKIRV